ncbi:protein brunelleschi [Neocloeon triangulifer]|uniref:protein brunelleschi n=1 Tax=Neocloeon triangulifer TaxID=2078957 RepID=UPI00286EC02F|nr:protein brunelleschi [Neocloeon triangulifer]
MRAAVTALLSAPELDTTMNKPDFHQTLDVHRTLLVLLKPIGKQLKGSVFSRLSDQVQKAVQGLKLTDSLGRERPVNVRLVNEYEPSQNDWGDFQTHRKLLGLLTVSHVTSQTELNEICRQHESLKVKYSSTLFDSRCLILGLNQEGHLQRSPSINLRSTASSPYSESPYLSPEDLSHSSDSSVPTSTNHSSVEDSCSDATSVADSTLTSPASPTPPLDDLSVAEAIPVALTIPSNFKARALYYVDEEAASRPFSANEPCLLDCDIREFVSSLFWVLEHKRLERSREKLDKVTLLLAPFEKKDIIGLDLESRANKRKSVGRGTKHLADLTLQAGLPSEASAHYSAAIDVLKSANDWLWLGGSYEGLCAASLALLRQQNGIKNGATPLELQHCLSPDEICKRYREAITHYSKYLNAAVLETEACFKAARVAFLHKKKLQASSFLQNVLLINLNLTEEHKIDRFLAIAELYQSLGFLRKASFFKRLAGMRHVSAQNEDPNWSQCYQLLIQALAGLKLSLDPKEMITVIHKGWPVLQIQLLHELVAASKRMGSNQIAVRHLTFLLHAMWPHLKMQERKDIALQLQAAASQEEGSPVALVLPETGLILPPANLIHLPHISTFKPCPLIASLRPQKIQIAKVETGPFLFTPLKFGSLDRSKEANSTNGQTKLDFLWVEGDVCEVQVILENHLPIELKVVDVRILTGGTVFESSPSTLVLPPFTAPDTESLSSLSSSLNTVETSALQVSLAGIPRAPGTLNIIGYSTHVLGVKSICLLGDLNHLHGQSQFTVEVVPAMPQLQISTTLPKIVNSSQYRDAATSGILSVYAGEKQEVVVTLTNILTDLKVSMLSVQPWSKLDLASEKEIFGTWDNKPLEILLPIDVGKQVKFSLHIYGKAQFFAPPADDTVSLASTAVSSSLNMSINSSKASLEFPSKPEQAKPSTIEGSFRIRYSGGPGFDAGYCRSAELALQIIVQPSLQIVKWDVLAAETPSEFYLVLDIINQTQQEAELCYAVGRTILVEGDEFCRVPVPLPKCPLNILSELYAREKEEVTAEVKAVCSKHVADNAQLKWTLADGRKGQLKLDGIKLSESMLDTIKASPLDWVLSVDGNIVRCEEEFTCKAGQPLVISVKLTNRLSFPLENVTLSISIYQDYQNGTRNYRLDTRVAIAGASTILLGQLDEAQPVEHSCALVFFTPGLFKADIQCCRVGGTCSTTSTWKLSPIPQFCVVD